MRRRIAIAYVLVSIMSTGAILGQSIRLPNRVVNPTAGLGLPLKDALDEPGRGIVQGIVQFHRTPTKPDRDLLAVEGIRFGQFLGGRAYVLEFPSGTDSSALDAVSNLIFWADVMEPSDRIEPALFQGQIEPWAELSDGRVTVIVEFLHDVPRPDAKQWLGTFTADFEMLGFRNRWAAIIRPADVEPIAASGMVYRIRQGPPPMLPL